MFTVLLLTHIALATALTILTLVTAVAAVQKRHARLAVQGMLQSFFGTFLSGVALVLGSHALLTHVCIMMTVVAIGVFAVKVVYEKRAPRLENLQ